MRPLVGIFDSRLEARQALRALRDAGFEERQLGVVTQDTAQGSTEKTDTLVEEGLLAGAATGATVGGLWAVGIAAGVLPAIGPVVAGGILASILASAAGGATVGGIVGTLIGLGFTEEEAGEYEQEIKAGRTLVTVQPEGRLDQAIALLQGQNARVLVRKPDGSYIGADSWARLQTPASHPVIIP